MGSDQKKKVADAKGRSNHPPKCVWALPQTYLRSSVIQEEVGVKSLLLCIERWFRKTPGLLLTAILGHVKLGGDPRADPGNVREIMSLTRPENAPPKNS